MSGHVIDLANLPNKFPTHKHESSFWENLGRAVATFGFLEDTLKKAILAFTATKPYNVTDIEKAYLKWISKLEKTLTDQLWNLTNTYKNAVEDHPDANIENFDYLIESLKEVSKIRNVICHGCWSIPNTHQASTPFFVNRNKERFEGEIDDTYLIQLQLHTTDLACSVINTVTYMGWQFPGTNTPGSNILE